MNYIVILYLIDYLNNLFVCVYKGIIYFFKIKNCYIFVLKKNKLLVCMSIIYIIKV